MNETQTPAAAAPEYMIVVNETLRQLGGTRVLAMLCGASNFGGSDEQRGAASFKLPQNSTRNRISHVRIVLTFADTYTVTFLNVRGTKIKTVSTHEDVYNDVLRDLFERETGLFTSIHARN